MLSFGLARVHDTSSRARNVRNSRLVRSTRIGMNIWSRAREMVKKVPALICGDARCARDESAIIVGLLQLGLTKAYRTSRARSQRSSSHATQLPRTIPKAQPEWQQVTANKNANDFRSSPQMQRQTQQDQNDEHRNAQHVQHDCREECKHSTRNHHSESSIHAQSERLAATAHSSHSDYEDCDDSKEELAHRRLRVPPSDGSTH